jgi:hypothetical protein
MALKENFVEVGVTRQDQQQFHSWLVGSQHLSELTAEMYASVIRSMVKRNCENPWTRYSVSTQGIRRAAWNHYKTWIASSVAAERS